MSSKPWIDRLAADSAAQRFFEAFGCGLGQVAVGDLFSTTGTLTGRLVYLALVSPETCALKIATPSELTENCRAVLRSWGLTAQSSLDRAMRAALLEAVIDIGGGGTRHCFMEHGTRIGVPVQVVYPLSGGRNLWHTRDPRAAEACACLRHLANHFSAAAETVHSAEWIEPGAAWELPHICEDFFSAYVAPELPPASAEIPDFHNHLSCWLLPRAWHHLGEVLGHRDYAQYWTAFVTLLCSAVFSPPVSIAQPLASSIAVALANLISAAGSQPLDEPAGLLAAFDADSIATLAELRAGLLRAVPPPPVS